MYLFVQHQINLSCLDSAASGAQHLPKLGHCVGAYPFQDLHTDFKAPAKVNFDLGSLDWLHPMLKSRRVWWSKHKAKVAGSLGST